MHQVFVLRWLQLCSGSHDSLIDPSKTLRSPGAWLCWRPASSCRVHRFFSFLCSDIFGWQTAGVIDIFTTPRPKLNFCCAFSQPGSRGDRIMISYTTQILDIIGFHTLWRWRGKFNIFAQHSARINHCNHQRKVVAVEDYNRGNIRPSLKLKYDFRVNRKITNDPSSPLLLLSGTISYLRNLIQRMQDQELTTIVCFKTFKSIHHSSPITFKRLYCILYKLF